jgi:hypothetical protein
MLKERNPINWPKYPKVNICKTKVMTVSTAMSPSKNLTISSYVYGIDDTCPISKISTKCLYF